MKKTLQQMTRKEIEKEILDNNSRLAELTGRPWKREEALERQALCNRSHDLMSELDRRYAEAERKFFGKN